MKFHFVIHEAFEGVGYFEHWLHERNYRSSHSRTYLGEALPTSELDFDCLIVLGGPQSPSTTIKECSYFDSLKEQELIRNAIENRKAVIGICLGAQLIGQALGAHYEASPHLEIGYFPIHLTTDGVEDPLFNSFEPTEIVGHWHNDMPGLTESAKVLAYSEGCPRQIIRYSEFVYGFQCHLEFVESGYSGLIEHSMDTLAKHDTYRYVDPESSMVNFSTNRMHQLLTYFMDNLVSEYLKRMSGDS
ncbi:glutamine amidotransferase [Vibrio zhugei]|uniref:Glutamine amidotransferase n=1 Tax=Vibrio zhugei TaxID=2479546 RepID=A0ABV7C9X0_9VIBR|nr:glutamine amidotransferase [Vibrio zhugei]